VNDIFQHMVLFSILSVVIVLMGTFYTEADDGKALRAYPKRLGTFFVGCGILTGIILVLEHTVASVA
jgi:hypothetical protein